MNDYLTDKDKEKLESIGFKPYNGMYGWKPRSETDVSYIIIALAKQCFGDEKPDIISRYSENGNVYHTSFDVAKDMCFKTIAPLPPKEIVFDAGRFDIESHGCSPCVLKDRLGLLIDSDIGMMVQEFRKNIDNGEYDLVLRRRK